MAEAKIDINYSDECGVTWIGQTRKGQKEVEFG